MINTNQLLFTIILILVLYLLYSFLKSNKKQEYFTAPTPPTTTSIGKNYTDCYVNIIKNSDTKKYKFNLSNLQDVFNGNKPIVSSFSDVYQECTDNSCDNLPLCNFFTNCYTMDDKMNKYYIDYGCLIEPNQHHCNYDNLGNPLEYYNNNGTILKHLIKCVDTDNVSNKCPMSNCDIDSNTYRISSVSGDGKNLNIEMYYYDSKCPGTNCNLIGGINELRGCFITETTNDCNTAGKIPDASLNVNQMRMMTFTNSNNFDLYVSLLFNSNQMSVNNIIIVNPDDNDVCYNNTKDTPYTIFLGANKQRFIYIPDCVNTFRATARVGCMWVDDKGNECTECKTKCCIGDSKCKFKCITGNCNGDLNNDNYLCKTTDDSGKSIYIGCENPATLVEFTLNNVFFNQDTYDVSIIDGYNVGVMVTPINSSVFDKSMISSGKYLNGSENPQSLSDIYPLGFTGGISCIPTFDKCPPTLQKMDGNNVVGCYSLGGAINDYIVNKNTNNNYFNIINEYSTSKLINPSLIYSDFGNSSNNKYKNMTKNILTDQLKSSKGIDCSDSSNPCNINDTNIKNWWDSSNLDLNDDGKKLFYSKRFSNNNVRLIDLAICSCSADKTSCNNSNGNCAFGCSPNNPPGSYSTYGFEDGGVCIPEIRPGLCYAPYIGKKTGRDFSDNNYTVKCAISGITDMDECPYDKILCVDKKGNTYHNFYPTDFKSMCPFTYSWQFDDLSSTFNSKNADYVITYL